MKTMNCFLKALPYLLVSLLTVTDAAAAKSFALAEIKMDVVPGGMTTVDHAQDYFGTHNTIFSTNPFTEADWGNHTDALATKITDKVHMLVFLAWATDTGEKSLIASAAAFEEHLKSNSYMKNKERLEKIISTLKNVGAITQDGACEALGYVFSYLTEDQVKALTPKCIGNALKTLQAKREHFIFNFNNEGLGHIRSHENFKDGFGDFVTLLEHDSKHYNSVSKLPTDFVDELLTVENCGKLTSAHVKALITGPNHSAYKAECAAASAAALKGVILAPNDKLTVTDDNLFLSNYNDTLDASIWKKLSAKQKEGYASNEEIETSKCHNIDLEKMGNITVKPVCFANYMESISGKDLNIAEWEKKSTVELIAALDKSKYDASLLNLKKNILIQFTKAQLEVLVKAHVPSPTDPVSYAHCEHIPAEAFNFAAGKSAKISDLEIDPECFALLQGPAQGILLAHDTKLTEKHTEKGIKLNNLIFSKSGKDIKGISVFEHIKSPKASEMRKAFDSADEHKLCGSISYSQLKMDKALSKFGSDISKECFQLVKSKPALKELVGPFASLAALMPLQDILPTIKDWNTLPADQYQSLIKRGGLCEEAKNEMVSKFSPAGLAHVDAECLKKLPERASLPADILNKLAPASFENLDATEARALTNIASLDDDRYGAISNGVKDSTKHFASTLTPAETGAMSADRVGKLQGIRLVPAASWAGFKDLSKVPEARLTAVELDQIAAAPESAVLGLTAPQIGQLGKDVKDAAKSPLSHLVKLKSKLNPDQVKALEAALAAVQEGSANSVTIGVTFIACILTVGFFLL